MSFGIPVRNGLGLGLLASTSLATGNVGGSAPFTPASLFASGAPGFLLDATLADLSSLFQDSAGTTPVTAVEQPVGLVLDTSQGLALGPELVTNGTFDANINGWAAGTTSGGTIAWQSPGSMRITRTSTTTTGQRTISVVAGVTYIITAQSTFVSGTGNPFLIIKDTDAATGGTILTNSSGPVAQSFSHVAYFTAPSTGTLYIHAGVGTANSVYDFDNITTKSIAGNHFVQSTSAARPVLSARVNLLTKTEQFDDAVWQKTALNTTGTPAWVNTAVAPDGTTTADTLIENTATAAHFVLQSVSGATGSLTFRAYVKAKERENISLQIDETASGANGAVASYNVDPATFAADTAATFGSKFSSPSSSIVSVGNDWFLCTLSVTTTAVGVRCYVFLRDGSTPYGAASYAGNGTSGIYVWGADLRVANDTASPVYQRVNTATDYDTTGFPIYLRYDGVDDFLVSAATVNFSTTAQMSVFAGVRKLSDAIDQVILENYPGSLIPSFSVYNAQLGTKGYTGILVGTGVLSEVEAQTFTAPDSAVLTELFNFAGSTATDEIQVRVNGNLPTQTVITAGPVTATDFGNRLTYIGRRGGTTFPLNGRIYFPLVVLGRTATATEIANMESYLSASMGGGYVPTGYDFLVTGDGDQLTDASGNALYTIPLYS